MDKLWHLSKIKIFAGMSAEDLAAIGEVTHMRVIPAHTLVQTPRSNPSGIYLIKNGKLRLYNLNKDGREFTLGILGNGNVFGQTSVFSLGTSDIYIETLEDTLICFFSKEQFERFLLERPAILLALTKSLSRRLDEQNRMLEQLALYDISQRTLFWLAKLAGEFGVEEGEYVTINLSLSHQELAHMIGATRESVSHVLSTLAKEGTIVSGRMKIGILKTCIQALTPLEEEIS